MFAINAPIPNLTGTRLEQFRMPQLRIQRDSNQQMQRGLNTSHP